MPNNGKKDWRSSDNLRSQVAKLEADQRNVRLEVQHLRDTMSQGFRDINEAIDRLAERTANRPTNWGVIASFIGVACVLFGLAYAPLIYFGKENREGIVTLFTQSAKHAIEIARLQAHEEYAAAEMKELSDQQRGAVKTAIDMNTKAMNAISDLREEFLRVHNTP